MTISDLKKAHSLGVQFHFSFISGLDGHGWSCSVDLLDDWNTDNQGSGEFIKTARGDYKRHKTIDAWLFDLVRNGDAPKEPRQDQFSILFRC